MGRYVDIDKVEWNKHYLAISNGTVVQETLQVDADYLNKLVEDVSPVVHAHWMDTFQAENGYYTGICSHCSLPNIVSSYCGKCGAKMDEEVEE